MVNQYGYRDHRREQHTRYQRVRPAPTSSTTHRPPALARCGIECGILRQNRSLELAQIRPRLDAGVLDE